MGNSLKDIANYCLECLLPKCETACPLGNPIKKINNLIKEGKIEEATKLLYISNPFPELTSLLCDHGRTCKGHCVKTAMNTPVDFPLIEYQLSKAGHNLECKKTNGHKIALVGAGIASLASAYQLLKDGYEVHIYEKESFVGGAIATGIPSFRFDKGVLNQIQTDLEKMGCHFHFNYEVGASHPLNELLREFDKVILAIGAETPNLAGFELTDSIMDGLSLLRDINIHNNIGSYSKFRHAIVWGGGNVAIDCARSLVRLIDEVTVVYRRGKEEAPASHKEMALAEQEGVNFHFLTNVKETIYEEGKLKGTICEIMELGPIDESGRKSFIGTGSFIEIPCDLLVFAIGEKPNLNIGGIDIKSLGNHKTNIDNLYIIGDAYLGASSVARSIKDSLTLAKEINSELII